jgi:hypothetical protein
MKPGPAQPTCITGSWGIVFCGGFFSAFSVAKERLNTEVTEALHGLYVEAFEAAEDTKKFVLVLGLSRCAIRLTRARLTCRASAEEGAGAGRPPPGRGLVSRVRSSLVK